MKKIVAFVPIKLNNERLPGKNIKPFSNGIPLINYILSSLIDSKLINEIYVYCSDEKIKDYIPEGVKFLARSSSLDTDSTKINDVMLSFMKDIDADYYVLTHATAPFIKTKTIDIAAEALLSGGYDSALTVEAKKEFLWVNGSPSNYDPKSIPRTQDLAPFHIESTGLYAYSKALVTNGRRIGDNPKLIEIDKIEAVDINEPIDFMVADALVMNEVLHK